MIVNPFLKNIFKEISSASVNYHNQQDNERKYLKKIHNVFTKHLTEDEQLFILKYMLELIHHRNIITDPDNILTIYNIKFRHFFMMFFISTTILITALVLMFNFNPFSGTFDTIYKVFKLLSLGG